MLPELPILHVGQRVRLKDYAPLGALRQQLNFRHRGTVTELVRGEPQYWYWVRFDGKHEELRIEVWNIQPLDG